MLENNTVRTDLALENPALKDTPMPGVSKEEQRKEGMHVTVVEVQNQQGAQALSKPIGKYITFELDSIQGYTQHFEGQISLFSKKLQALLPPKGLVLVVGLGNADITPDAVGPQTIDGILSTRHLTSMKDSGFENLRPVAAVAPGVLGQTGVETAELIRGVCEKIKPVAIVAVDALAARSLSRLGRTIQLANSGISPGSGVQNSRKELSEKTLGIPVIAVGVPTVVDMGTIAYDLTDGKVPPSEEAATMMVTPREIDKMIAKSAKLLSLGINCALQSTLNLEEVQSLTDLC